MHSIAKVKSNPPTIDFHIFPDGYCTTNQTEELEVSSLGSLACSSRHFRAQLCNEDAWRQADFFGPRGG